MKILVACEESQAVTKEFRKLGHEAYSCDLEPCSGGHPEWHLRQDVMELLSGIRNPKTWERIKSLECSDEDITDEEVKRLVLNMYARWDMIIAFPPCTHLASSGARWFKEKQADGRQQNAIDFFMAIANAPCEKIAIENPIGIMSTVWRKPDQIIHPWQFGHGETKATCLWLKNLPLLKPTNIVEGREQRIWRMGPSPDRSKLRSKTFLGIARAIAEQFGKGD